MDPNSTPSQRDNDLTPAGIPGRRRRLLAVLAIALVAGAAAAVAVVATSGGGGQAQATVDNCKPFSGAPPLQLDLPGNPALPADDAAVLAAARRLLPAGDVRIGVAEAVAGYPGAGASATLARLHSLDQSQPVVRLYEGLVELWAGRCGAAQTTLEQVRSSDMWGFYGTIADNTLHTSQRPSYPVYIPPPGTPAGSVHRLEALARAHPGMPGPWLALAYVLQATDHRGALAAARRAETADPGGVSPQVASAVLGYDKDHPARSIGALGTLISQGSDTPEVRFHLGELLYWFGDPTDAAAQWRQVMDDAPGSVYGRTARELLAKIS